MTHSDVVFLTALAFVLIMGAPERCRWGNQIGSDVGRIPSEDSRAGRQQLGYISRAALCCGSCRWRQHKRRCVRDRIGAVGTFIGRCVGKRALRRWQRWRFGCTGCGEENEMIDSFSSSVRRRESSLLMVSPTGPSVSLVGLRMERRNACVIGQIIIRRGSIQNDRK